MDDLAGFFKFPTAELVKPAPPEGTEVHRPEASERRGGTGPDPGYTAEIAGSPCHKGDRSGGAFRETHYGSGNGFAWRPRRPP